MFSVLGLITTSFGYIIKFLKFQYQSIELLPLPSYKQGCVSHCDDSIYIKKYLKTKRRITKTQNMSPCKKHNLQKIL